MKKIISLILVAALFTLVLTGCGSASTTASTTATSTTTTTTEQAAPAETVQTEETVPLSGDGIDPNLDYGALAGQTITIASAPAPHAAILEIARDILAQADITLDIRVFEDYVIPNNVVESGEIYANYFQHIPYLEWFNEEYGTHLVNAGGIHIEPQAIYAGKSSSLEDIPDGAQIAVPADTTNEARALYLLDSAGLLKLNPTSDFAATIYDIAENPHNIEFVEIESTQIPNILKDVDFGIIPGNYAIEHGLNILTDAVFIEGASSAYVNVIAVKEGNENNDLTKALVAAVQSDAVRQHIAEEFPNGSVVSVF